MSLVFVAESPPHSQPYFYDPTGKTSEHLFSAIMKECNFRPLTKDDGLQELRRRGWVLVDATYEAVNKLSPAERNRTIERDYSLLCGDLAGLIPGRKAPLVLIKKNICELLEPRLTSDGYNVLNRGRAIYFPSHGRQNDFRRQFRAILQPTGLSGE